MWHRRRGAGPGCRKRCERGAWLAASHPGGLRDFQHSCCLSGLGPEVLSGVDSADIFLFLFLYGPTWRQRPVRPLLDPGSGGHRRADPAELLASLSVLEAASKPKWPGSPRPVKKDLARCLWDSLASKDTQASKSVHVLCSIVERLNKLTSCVCKTLFPASSWSCKVARAQEALYS